MPSLLEAQRAFAAALLGAAPAPLHMAVYRANVFGNWSAALTGAYPVVRAIVGAEFFGGLAHHYAHAHPSQSGDLNAYGSQLAAFLDSFAHTRDLPYLPDVARLEWLVHRAYYAAQAAPFDPARPEQARLAPACAFLESAWPLAQIWQAHQEGGKPAAVDLHARPGCVLVHRPGWRVEVSPLGTGDHALLRGLHDGAALGAALEAAVAADPAFLPGVSFPAWVNAGVIVR
jgi:hypothetical protein